MDLISTLVIGFALLGLGLVSGWRGAKPPNLAAGPRLIPWRGIMLTCAAIDLMLLVHLANLLGVQTGR